MSGFSVIDKRGERKVCDRCHHANGRMRHGVCGDCYAKEREQIRSYRAYLAELHRIAMRFSRTA